MHTCALRRPINAPYKACLGAGGVWACSREHAAGPGPRGHAAGPCMQQVQVCTRHAPGTHQARTTGLPSPRWPCAVTASAADATTAPATADVRNGRPRRPHGAMGLSLTTAVDSRVRAREAGERSWRRSSRNRFAFDRADPCYQLRRPVHE